MGPGGEMRANAAAMRVIVDPVCKRAERNDLEKIIQDLDDDRQPRPERLRQARSQIRSQRRDDALDAVAPIRFAIERIISGNDLSPIYYLERGLVAAGAVGRIEVVGPRGAVVAYGTGFLVADGVLITNAHVLTTAAEVGRSRVQLRYELDIDGNELTPVTFQLLSDPEPIINVDLDVAVVGVALRSSDGRDLRQFGWLRLDPTPGKGAIGEYLTIIQHPNGERKQICVRENKLLKYDANGPYLWYLTDTVGGSSGSPVFNNSWDVVGLHHSGVPRSRTTEDGTRVLLTRDGRDWDPSTMTDDDIDWFANEGIRISRIVDLLAAVHPNSPLTKAILRGERSPRFDPGRSSPESAQAGGSQLGGDGVLRMNIPIEVRLGLSGFPHSPTPPPAPETVTDSYGGWTPPGPRLTEAVRVDQSNYKERNGYDPEFLGGGMKVPLPTVSPATQRLYGKTTTRASSALTYYNYSVVFNTERRLAYYSACNVQSDLFQGEAREGDQWYDDPRLRRSGEPPFEIDNSWYGQQREFEADRTPNPFDRGHLCSRKHLQWGTTPELAKRNGDDSFHFTNCAPQHWQFNQNSKANGLWFATEDEVLKRTDTNRLCVINGPVFNASASTQGADGLWRLNPTGDRVQDPVFGGVAIPKQFFKVIVWLADQTLRYLAFVVTQEGLLETIDRIDWPGVQEGKRKPQGLTDGEAELYSVPLSTVATLTGLGFGALDRSAPPRGEERAQKMTPIEGLSDLSREIASLT